VRRVELRAASARCGASASRGERTLSLRRDGTDCEVQAHLCVLVVRASWLTAGRKECEEGIQVGPGRRQRLGVVSFSSSSTGQDSTFRPIASKNGCRSRAGRHASPDWPASLEHYCRDSSAQPCRPLAPLIVANAFNQRMKHRMHRCQTSAPLDEEQSHVLPRPTDPPHVLSPPAVLIARQPLLPRFGVVL